MTSLLLALFALPVFYAGIRFERWRAHKREVRRRERTFARYVTGECVEARVRFTSPEDAMRRAGA